MEILKSSRYLGRKLALGVIALCIFIAIALFANSSLFAYAANDDFIGSGGGYLEVADITQGEVIGHSSAKTGRTYKITMPLAANGVFIAFDVASSEDIWAIRDDENKEDIPYLQVTEKVDEHKVTTNTLGTIYSSWSAVSITEDEKIVFVTVHQNGVLYVKCTLPEESPLEESVIVNKIDCLAPIMHPFNFIRGLRDENGKPIFLCKNTVFEDKTDTSGTLSSSRSGVQEVLIIRTDVALGPDTDRDSLNSDGIEKIASWTPLSLSTTTAKAYVDFTISKDGYYYYFVVDRVGNLNISLLLGDKFEREDYSQTDDRFFVYSKTGDITFSVKDKMISIGEEIEQYADQVNEAIYNNVANAYSALLLRFYSGASETDLLGVSEEWFSFNKNEYLAFCNAYGAGATFDINVTNKDLLPGELTCRNLNKNTVNALAGDKVVADFIVARYNLNEIDPQIGQAAGITIGSALKLSYKLTVEGVVSQVPKSNLGFYLETGADMSNVVVVVKKDEGYVRLQQIRGLNFIEFYTMLNQADFYVVYEVEEETDNLLPLWITLGVVGGVAVIGVAVYFILLKLNKLPKWLMFKKKTVKAEIATEVNEEEAPVVTKKANNKSKKGKKKRG